MPLVGCGSTHTVALYVLAHRRHDMEPNTLKLGECREQCSGLLAGYVILSCTESHLCLDVFDPLIDIGDQAGAVILGGHPRDRG